MTAKTVEIGGHRVELKHLDKVFFRDSGIDKRDLIDYYRRIAETALRHYRDRPLTLQRFPDGVDGDGFFQKERPDYYPDWIKSIRLRKKGGHVEHVLANDQATLVYLANQGCITLHLALALGDAPHHPDRVVFDLDPSDDDFSKVVFAAHKLKTLLDNLELTSFLQTTGSRGLHIVVPLDRKARFELSRRFARAAAERVAGEHPDVLTTEQRKEKRGKRVFIDYLRNAYGQTSVAPYSVRAREGAPVAAPLRWRELGAREMSAQRYTIKNIFKRLARIEDPWKSIARRGQSLDRALRELE